MSERPILVKQESGPSPFLIAAIILSGVAAMLLLIPQPEREHQCPEPPEPVRTFGICYSDVGDTTYVGIQCGEILDEADPRYVASCTQQCVAECLQPSKGPVGGPDPVEGP